jgi:hypothetical protein
VAAFLLPPPAQANNRLVRKESHPMSTYPLPELIRRWEQSQISAEQVIGQLLLHQEQLAETLSARLAEAEKRIRHLEQMNTRNA